jgi:cytochrome c oxidase assembly protein subunit 15
MNPQIPQAAYDLAPLYSMLLVGLLLALIPLAWVVWRNRLGSATSRVQALTVLALFLTFDLILFGAFTRLTDSGLGCPDWPGCYGTISPAEAAQPIASAEAALPDGPVTQRKAWIEMIHRYLAMVVGAVILFLTVQSWRVDRKNLPMQNGISRSASNPWWPTAALVWVCVQGAFGALTVTMKLFPAIVTLHFLGALLLLGLLTAQVVLQNAAAKADAKQPSPSLNTSLKPMPLVLPASLGTWLGVLAAAVMLQIALGAWVSSNYAVLACSDFPQCQRSWWPTMDFLHGFQIWRPLGLAADGHYIGFASLTAIHYVHRMMAGVVVLLSILTLWRIWGVAAMRRPAGWLAALLAAQLLTGLGNVLLGWPLLAALLHSGGAAALVVVLTWLHVLQITKNNND